MKNLSLHQTSKQTSYIIVSGVLCLSLTACDLSSEERQHYFTQASHQQRVWQEQPAQPQEYRACDRTYHPCRATTQGVHDAH